VLLIPQYIRWPTFSFLAGGSVTDDPPVPPKTPDPADPYANIYGEDSFPPLDGVNVWPFLMKVRVVVGSVVVGAVVS